MDKDQIKVKRTVDSRITLTREEVLDMIRQTLNIEFPDDARAFFTVGGDELWIMWSEDA